MNTLRDATVQDLAALLTCLDHYERRDADDAAKWKSNVFEEMRRRFAVIEENTKTMEAARAARGG